MKTLAEYILESTKKSLLDFFTDKTSPRDLYNIFTENIDGTLRDKIKSEKQLIKYVKEHFIIGLFDDTSSIKKYVKKKELKNNNYYLASEKEFKLIENDIKLLNSEDKEILGFRAIMDNIGAYVYVICATDVEGGLFLSENELEF